MKKKQKKQIKFFGAPAAHVQSWGYKDISNWHENHPSALGEHQSPINITTEEMSEEPIGVFYTHYHDFGTAQVVNNGHAVSWNFLSDAGGVILNDKFYKLISFHHHSPTEHTFNGKHLGLALHFIHMHLETGELLVMGYNLDVDGEELEFQGFLDEIQPEMSQDHVHLENVRLSLIEEFEGRFVHYQGSLTTPPCTQLVKWFVSNHCHRIDQYHLDWFKACIPHHNHREAQPRNERCTKIYEKRTWSKHFKHSWERVKHVE